MAITLNGTTGITTPAETATTSVTTPLLTSPASTALTIQSAGTTAMTVSTAQKILIGTTTAASGGGVVQTIVGQGSNDGGIQLTSGTGVSGGGMAINSIAGGGAKFFNFTGNSGSESYTEAMRINSSGFLLVNSTSTINGACISSLGRISAQAYNVDTSFQTTNQSGTAGYNAAAFFNNGTSLSLCGTINVSGSTTAYNTSSDYRLKENVTPMTNGLASINALSPITYDWISDKSTGEGFIAHELQAVIPLAVTGEKDAVDAEGKIKPQGVDYSKIVVHLVAACQELSAKNDALEARLAALEAK